MMYTVLPTGEVKGVLRDYDLASRDVHPTVNRDHTGTIPFMALEIVEYRFEKRIPQLYRHDSESFIWVLAYLTLANVEYNEIRFVKISRPLPTLDPWFAGVGPVHIPSKHVLFFDHGTRLSVAGPYERYRTIIRCLVKYWIVLDHDSGLLRSF